MLGSENSSFPLIYKKNIQYKSLPHSKYLIKSF